MVQSIEDEGRQREKRHCAFAADFTSRCSALHRRRRRCCIIYIFLNSLLFQANCWRWRCLYCSICCMVSCGVCSVLCAVRAVCPSLSFSPCRPMLYMLWCVPSDCQSQSMSTSREVDSSLASAECRLKWLFPDFAFPFYGSFL